MKPPLTSWLDILPISGTWGAEDYAIAWVLELLAYTIVGIILFVIYDFIESATAIRREGSGVIVDKLYKPDASSTGTAIGFTSGGQMTTGTVTHHSPEAWFVMVNVGQFQIEKVYCSDDFYYRPSTRQGQAVQFYWKQSKFTGKRINAYNAIE